MALRQPATSNVEKYQEKYDQNDLNTYGAEDDDEMDSILTALERASNEEKPAPSRE